MPPLSLTDEQMRADEAAFQSAVAYNQIIGDLAASNLDPITYDFMASMQTDQQRTALIDWARNTYGDQAAADMTRQLDARTLIDPVGIGNAFAEQYPRLDTSTPTAEPTAPAPAPAEETPTPTPASDAPPWAPGDGRVWLPGNAELPRLNDEDTAALNRLDAAVESFNEQFFHVDPALAWFPDGAQLPSTGTNISTLGDTFNAVNAVLPKWRVAIEELSTAFEGSGEYLIHQQLERIRDSIADATSAVESSQSLPGLVSKAGVAVNDAFHQLRGEQLGKRSEMAEIVAGLRERLRMGDPMNPGWGFLAAEDVDTTELTARGAFAEISPVSSSLDTIAPAQQRGRDIGALAATLPTVTALSPTALATQDANTIDSDSQASSDTAASTPAATASASVPSAAPSPASSPGSSTSSPGQNSSSDSGSSLADLLSTLGSQSGDAAQTPSAAQAAQPLQQAAQQAAQPLEQMAQTAAGLPDELLKALREAEADQTDAAEADTPAAEAAAADRDAATSSTFVMPGAASPSTLGAPGSDARPNQLDANGKPVDKNGDGKVDEDAVPLSKNTVRPFDLSLSADGENLVVAGVTDPRLGEMMLNMAQASEDAPMAVLEAAAAAGMPLESLGDPLDPDQARVGDAVVGDTMSGIYLGEGAVLTSTGEVTDLWEVVGDNGFVAEIPLPELPDDPAAAESAETQVSSASGEGPAPIEPIAPLPADAVAGDVTQPLDTAPPPAAEVAPEPESAPASPAQEAPQPSAGESAPVAQPEPAAAAPTPTEPTPEPAPQFAAAAAPAQTASNAGGLPREVEYEGRPLGA